MKTLLLFLSVTIRVPDFVKMNIAVEVDVLKRVFGECAPPADLERKGKQLYLLVGQDIQ